MRGWCRGYGVCFRGVIEGEASPISAAVGPVDTRAGGWKPAIAPGGDGFRSAQPILLAGDETDGRRLGEREMEMR